MDNEAQDHTLDRFSALVRQAHLYSSLKSKVAGHMMENHPDFADLDKKANQAEVRVWAYAGVCIADEAQKPREGRPSELSPKFQEAFSTVSNAIDVQIEAGPENRHVRAALLENAKKFSNEYHPGKEVPGGQLDAMRIAKALNDTQGFKGDFHSYEARELTWSCGRVEHELSECIANNTAVFLDNRDIKGILGEKPMGLASVRHEIKGIDEEIAGWKDPTLQRLDEQERERELRAKRAYSMESSGSDRSVRSILHEQQPVAPASGAATPLDRSSRESSVLSVMSRTPSLPPDSKLRSKASSRPISPERQNSQAAAAATPLDRSSRESSVLSVRSHTPSLPRDSKLLGDGPRRSASPDRQDPQAAGAPSAEISSKASEPSPQTRYGLRSLQKTPVDAVIEASASASETKRGGKRGREDDLVSGKPSKAPRRGREGRDRDDGYIR